LIILLIEFAERFRGFGRVYSSSSTRACPRLRIVGAQRPTKIANVWRSLRYNEIEIKIEATVEPM
jgi:hypothetical protein